jgi:hypothetical protein
MQRRRQWRIAKELLSTIPPAEVAKAPALDKAIGQTALKRHLDRDSTYGSNKRARLSHSTGELDELDNSEDNTSSSKESEAASREDSEGGSSEDGEQTDSEGESSDQWH